MHIVLLDTRLWTCLALDEISTNNIIWAQPHNRCGMSWLQPKFQIFESYLYSYTCALEERPRSSRRKIFLKFFWINSVHDMPKRYYVQRQHIIHSVRFFCILETISNWREPFSLTCFCINCTRCRSSWPLLYGSMFSGWVSSCYYVQSLESLIQAGHCVSSSQRHFSSIFHVCGPIRLVGLRKGKLLFLISSGCVRRYLTLLIWILTFLLTAYLPSKFQLLTLDLLIIILQLLLITIAYETSVYYNNKADDPEDILLPSTPVPSTLSIPLFQSSLDTSSDSAPFSPSLPSKTMSPTNAVPIVVDLRFTAIMRHFRHPPPPSRSTVVDPVLPLPNTTPWPLPAGMRMLMRASRQIRDVGGAGTSTGPPFTGGREVTVPGAIDIRD